MASCMLSVEDFILFIHLYIRVVERSSVLYYNKDTSSYLMSHADKRDELFMEDEEDRNKILDRIALYREASTKMRKHLHELVKLKKQDPKIEKSSEAVKPLIAEDLSNIMSIRANHRELYLVTSEIGKREEFNVLAD